MECMERRRFFAVEFDNRGRNRRFILDDSSGVVPRERRSAFWVAQLSDKKIIVTRR